MFSLSTLSQLLIGHLPQWEGNVVLGLAGVCGDAWEANKEFEDASVQRALIAGVPYPLSPIPLLFSLPPYPLPISTPATHAT